MDPTSGAGYGMPLGRPMTDPALLGLSVAPTAKSIPTTATRFRKAPDAPKRFKSAFIIFSAEKHKEIKENLTKDGKTEKTTDIAKLVSETWRGLNAEDKEVWEKKARKDKARYEVEKAMYKGPWKVPANKRTPKDPSAPKRPMSAFLAFSNKRRAALKRQHPEATNADLSKMLSKTWKEAPEELRRKYMDEEAGLRAKYKVEMGKWRKKVAEEKKAERKERESVALQAAEALSTERANAAAAGLDTSRFDPANFQQHQLAAAGLGGSSMYGNPYAGFAGAGGSGNLQGDLSGLSGLQGGGFPGMLGSGGYGGQAAMMGSGSAQQQLLNQILFQNSGGMPPGLGQRGGLGMFGQGLPGSSGAGGLGGFGAGGNPGGSFGGDQGGAPGAAPGAAVGGFPYVLPPSDNMGGGMPGRPGAGGAEMNDNSMQGGGRGGGGGGQATV